ncbi:MAG TPA: ABC transporter permease subunit [Clostridiaceae bacterium]|nr:ABC transporter permease subunit [Clostridiaceae bacterium]
MKPLIKYEFLKILRKKSALIIMAVSLLIAAFLFALPIMQYQAYNQDGVIKGLEGIAYEKEQYMQLSVVLTEEYIADTIREYQKLFENPDNVGYDGNERFLIGDAYWNFVAPREKLLSIIAANYNKPGEYKGLSKLTELDMTTGADFYKTRNEKVEALLNTPSRSMSEKQKEYWQNMSSQVQIPFQYGYYEGWEIIISSFELLMFAVLAICIAIAPVFSGEYQAGTDAVILSAKYGKTKLITAKIVSSFVFGILAFTLHVVVACGLLLITFGVDGWNLPVQVVNTTIPYPFTFLEAVIINLTIIYLVLLAMISLTLFLSAKMKNSYLVLAVLVPVLFIPIFLSPNGTTGIYNLILFLLPYRCAMPELNKYISYQFGGLVLDVLTIRAILYPVLTAIMLPFARLGFKKHQVLV